jgi:hypothetical protein
MARRLFFLIAFIFISKAQLYEDEDLRVMSDTLREELVDSVLERLSEDQFDEIME